MFELTLLETFGIMLSTQLTKCITNVLFFVYVSLKELLKIQKVVFFCLERKIGERIFPVLTFCVFVLFLIRLNAERA